MFNLFDWEWLKRLGFNKLFNAGDALADKTETEWDDGLVRIGRDDYKPIIKKTGMFPACTKIFILNGLQFTVDFAKKNKKCAWVWGWLREAQNILAQIDL